MKRNLRLSTAEAFFSSLMMGAGESYFAVYALSQGLGEILSGFIVGLPIMLGACFQLITPTLLRLSQNVKKFVLLTSGLQASILALLAVTASFDKGRFHPFIIFLLIGIYWGLSFATATAWNFWMGGVIPEEERTRFFSLRGQLTQYGVMAGLALTGAYLHAHPEAEFGVQSFILPFLFAFLSRMIAMLIMALQMAPVVNAEAQVEFTPELNLSLAKSFKQLRQVFSENPEAHKVILFLFFFNSAIFISSPFVTPFLIAKRGFDSTSFMAAQIALFLGKTWALLFVQKWIKRFGVRRVMFIGALGMSPLPAVWFFVTHTLEAVFLQALSGFFWGLFEVAVALVLFSEFPQKDKVQLLTWHQFFYSVAILIGTLFGGQVMSLLDQTIFSYLTIFFIGSSLRTLLVLSFVGKISANAK